MTKSPKLSPEEQQRQALLERYKAKARRQMEDRFIEQMRAEEEAEKAKSG